MICILLSSVRNMSSPGIGFFKSPNVSIGRPILSFFTFFKPVFYDNNLLLTSSMPSCPLSSMLVNPIIFEKDLPPK